MICSLWQERKLHWATQADPDTLLIFCMRMQWNTSITPDVFVFNWYDKKIGLYFRIYWCPSFVIMCSCWGNCCRSALLCPNSKSAKSKPGATVHPTKVYPTAFGASHFGCRYEWADEKVQVKKNTLIHRTRTFFSYEIYRAYAKTYSRTKPRAMCHQSGKVFAFVRIRPHSLDLIACICIDTMYFARIACRIDQ